MREIGFKQGMSNMNSMVQMEGTLGNEMNDQQYQDLQIEECDDQVQVRNNSDFSDQPVHFGQSAVGLGGNYDDNVIQEPQVETEETAIQTAEMSHFENFSTMMNLSEGQSTFLTTLIAKMAETGLEDLVEWKKPKILTIE